MKSLVALSPLLLLPLLVTDAAFLHPAAARTTRSVHGTGLWVPQNPREQKQQEQQLSLQKRHFEDDTNNLAVSLPTQWFAAILFSLTIALANPLATPSALAAAVVDDGGASVASNSKITTGGASTLQSGRTISITRGVNLDNSNFANQNLRGVAFQQSIVRDANFQNANLVGASFFDATVDGSDFTNADMTLVNVEMAQFNRAILRNTIMKEAYVSGATLFQGIKDIEGSDWTDTYLRPDQQKYLCNHPTAKGTNPKTGVDTRESLMCKD